MRDSFWDEDANLILALPVHQGRDNSLAWHFDKHGIFSVKSAYKVAREDFIRNRAANGQHTAGGEWCSPEQFVEKYLEASVSARSSTSFGDLYTTVTLSGAIWYEGA